MRTWNQRAYVLIALTLVIGWAVGGRNGLGVAALLILLLQLIR